MARRTRGRPPRRPSTCTLDSEAVVLSIHPPHPSRWVDSLMRLEVRLQQHLTRGHGPRPPSLRSNGFVDDEVAAIALLAVLLATQGPHCRQRRAKRLDIDPRISFGDVEPSSHHQWLATSGGQGEEADMVGWLAVCAPFERPSSHRVTNHHLLQVVPALGSCYVRGEISRSSCTRFVLSSILKSHRRLGAR